MIYEGNLRGKAWKLDEKLRLEKLDMTNKFASYDRRSAIKRAYVLFRRRQKAAVTLRERIR